MKRKLTSFDKVEEKRKRTENELYELAILFKN